MNRPSDKIAILQIIPDHHSLLPNNLLRALVFLGQHKINYTFYDIEKVNIKGIGLSLESLLESIKEDTVIVSLACNNNYPKVTSLIFLYIYLHILKGKKIHICSPYLSFYDLSSIKRENVFFNFKEIDEFLADIYALKPLDGPSFYKLVPGIIKEHGYSDYVFWTYLTFGCPAACSFCYNRFLKKGDPKIIYNQPHSVINWMKLARITGKDYFEFVDPNFISDKKFTLSFLDNLSKDSLPISWRCKCRLDMIDQDIYEKMIAAGCKTIFFGMEHVSSRLVNSLNKGENTTKCLAEFLTYWKKKVALEFSFIAGMKGESVKDLKDNLAFISKLQALQKVSVYLGYEILFNQKKRVRAKENYLIAFLLLFNSLSSDKEIELKFLNKLLSFCLNERFFDFFILTENEDSLDILQEIVRYYRANKSQKVMRDYGKFMDYQGGEFSNMLLKSKSLEELNKKILTKLESVKG